MKNKKLENYLKNCLNMLFILERNTPIIHNMAIKKNKIF